MSNENKSKNIIMNEEEQSLLLNHDYDGIEEFDYPLPSWWVGTFIGGVVFGALYILYYSFAGGPSIQDEYNHKMAEVNKVREEQSKLVGKFQPDQYQAWIVNKDADERALEVYEENCLSCHEEKGKGDIGPNLTDKYWKNLKVADEQDIYQFVIVGNEDAGMPAWGDVLSKEELFAAVKYVISIKNTNVPGKEPEGEAIE